MFSKENTDVDFYKQILEPINNKKALKAVLPLLEQRASSAYTGLQHYYLIIALLDIIDWKTVFESMGSKDNIKFNLFAKRIKQLSADCNFVDHFSIAFSYSANKSFLLRKIKEFLKALKLTHSVDVMIAASLASNYYDDDMQKTGTALLRDLLKEMFMVSVPVDFPHNFTIYLAQLLRLRENDFKDLKEETKFFFESSLLGLKEPKVKPLLTTGDLKFKGIDNLKAESSGVDYIKTLKSDVKLKEFLMEQGSPVLSQKDVFLRFFKETTDLKETNVLEAIFYMISENLKNQADQPLSQSKQISMITNMFLTAGQFDFAQARAQLAEKSDTGRWEIELFIKRMDEIFGTKLNWSSIVRSITELDYLKERNLQDKAVFDQFLAVIMKLKEIHNIKLHKDIFASRWNASRLQFGFLLNVFRKTDAELISLADMNEAKSNISLEHASSQIAAKVKELNPVFGNKDLLRALIELADDLNDHDSALQLLEPVFKTNFEGLFYLLIQLKIKPTNALYERIAKNCMIAILGSSATLSDIIEAFFKFNRPLLIHSIASVCESEQNFIYLSKLLDYSQSIKDFFITLTQTEYHYFSIALALLAIKREFLRLENYVEERLINGGPEWIENFIRYVYNNVYLPLKDVSNPSKKTIEDVLEKSQLTMNGLAIIFENFLLSDAHANAISENTKSKIKTFYEKLKDLLPELAQVCINDTEKKANQLLENVYFNYITIEEFTEQMVQLKSSTSNRDQEILSCIIINIIDEFRFYQNFPEKELYITSDIFGMLIKHKIIEGKALIIFLKAISDSLEKEGKMFKFGYKALMHFINDMSLNISGDFYKLLFANEKLRENYFKVLYELQNQLKKTDKLQFIADDHLAIVNKKMEAFLLPKIKEEQKLKKSLKDKLTYESTKFTEKNLMEYLTNLFISKDKKLGIDERSKEKCIFWLNSLEDTKKLDEKLVEFEAMMDSLLKMKWFALYIVYKRVPSEPAVQNVYRKLIYRSKVEKLYRQVYKVTMKMINQVIDFVISKENLLPEERNISRFCGKWVGFITLVCNRPILLKDLNIKARIIESIDKKSVTNIIPVVCSLLSMIEKSTLFNHKIPFINALFDLLREVLSIPWISHTTKIFIEVLFNEMKMTDDKIYSFNYLQNRANSEVGTAGGKNQFLINVLPNRVKIDLSGISELELQNNLHVDLKQIVAMAIDLSIKDIIKPVLDRSVKNTLETTRELALKDFCTEPDEKKLLMGAEAMITNLTWNLALVTCREPLRVQITDHLENLLGIQTDLDEATKKMLRERLGNQNLELACSIVKKIVIDNALEEINKDKLIQEEVNKRKQAKVSGQKFVHDSFVWLSKELPSDLRPVENSGLLESIEIYTRAPNQPSNTFLDNTETNQTMWSYQPKEIEETKPLEDSKIAELITTLENEIDNPNNEDKLRTIHGIYSNLSKILQTTKNIDSQVFEFAKTILDKLLFGQHSIEKIKYYTDVLIIYSNCNTKLPHYITKYLFSLDDQRCFKAYQLSVFLRRNLIHLKDFDSYMAESLRNSNISALNCIIQVLKNLVIEEKIFSIHSFPKILAEITSLGKTDILKSVSLESSIFIKNLVDYMENENQINSLKFRLTNLEPEYNKLFQDVHEYFKAKHDSIYQLVEKALREWIVTAKTSNPVDAFNEFDEKILKGDEKDLIVFFCYLFEIVVNGSMSALNNSVQHLENLDYTYLDGVTNFISKLLVFFNDKSIFIFEKTLTSLIIVLTKKHFYDVQMKFNQRPFFKILHNILANLHHHEFDFNERIESFSVVFVQTLHILQPIKYPGFAFAWLQLVSSKYIMNTLLREKDIDIWNHYTILITDLMIFYKDVFTVDFMKNEEMRAFYKGSLRVLLVLIHDFPDFLCEQSFVILEEVPAYFKQFRNIVLSSYPKALKIPNPFDTTNQNVQAIDDYKILPAISQKVEARINSHNLHTSFINYIKKNDSQDFNYIMNSFYIIGYKNERHINVPLLESFTIYVPYFIYSSKLIRLLQQPESIGSQCAQRPELYTVHRKLRRACSIRATTN